MNIVFNKIDELNAELSISLSKEDIDPKIESALKGLRKKANIPGFRPGQAPVSMLKKMYGKSVLLDEVNQLASETLTNYLKDNEIDILGQPLANNDSNFDFNIDNANFDFKFDLGLSPKFDLNISDQTSVTYYKIKVNESDIDEEIKNLSKRYSSLAEAQVIGENDVVECIVNELGENDQVLEGGIQNKTIKVLPEVINDLDTKNTFIGKKVGDTFSANIFEMYKQNHKMLAKDLEMPEELVADLNQTFKIEVKTIQQYIPAEINQEFFDKVLGENVVTNIEEFRTKILENLELYYKGESDHQFEHSLDHILMDNHPLPLPSDFLKRWLIANYPDQYNDDNIDSKFENEEKGLRMQLVNEKITEKYNIEINDADINDAALGLSAHYIRQYGIPNPEFEWIKEFAEKQLKDTKFANQAKEMALRVKIMNQLKQTVTLIEEEVTIEAFYEKLKNHNELHHKH